MTEEEKKAIETINLFLNKPVRFKNKNIIANNEIVAIKTLLNLIEKLKKENHDLNNKVWLYTDKYNDMVISNGKYLDKIIKLEKNSIPKDKIRELFKELYMVKEIKFAKIKTTDNDKLYKFAKDIQKLLEGE